MIGGALPAPRGGAQVDTFQSAAAPREGTIATAARSTVCSADICCIIPIQSILDIDDLIADGIANQIRHRTQLQFVVNRGPVGLDGLYAQIEDGPDLFIAIAFG